MLDTTAPTQGIEQAASGFHVLGELTVTALNILRHVCNQHLSSRHTNDVVDLMTEPHQAVANQIVATPTLIPRLPEPMERNIGDLSNPERVILGLELA